MKPNHTAAPADPVLLALLGGWLAAEALGALLIAAAALLLTLGGWRPAYRSGPELCRPIHKSSRTIHDNPPEPAPDPSPLAGLRVVELRALARAAGLPQLARSGRREQLLAALASRWPTRIELSSMGQLYSQCKSQRMI